MLVVCHGSMCKVNSRLEASCLLRICLGDHLQDMGELSPSHTGDSILYDLAGVVLRHLQGTCPHRRALPLSGTCSC